MNTHEKYMSRCIELAKKGAMEVSPNPMVGCVLVHNNEIIGEGYHEKYGEAHAEVNAIKSVKNKDLLCECTLYVSLEPCAHHGKTPPCSDLIVRKQIPKVVIGTVDPFAEVAGKGIEKLKNNGIEVTVDVLKKECLELNKRFFTFHEKKRPFIILKWAQTSDGFIDVDRNAESYGEPTWITGSDALVRVHQMRAMEDAILVGTGTAEKDNPSLTVRLVEGKNPLRIILDRKLKLSPRLNLFDNSTETLVINSLKSEKRGNTELVQVDYSLDILPQILEILYKKEKLSLIVEGGRKLLQSFIDQNLWDEAHIFNGSKTFNGGVPAPKLSGEVVANEIIGRDFLQIFRNPVQGS
ncbi:bifunctional diaminohydroxyphosphoribosylaminopyrimidine deaminase/5-amino-6-(5-phosphoribosylamino)uracil reductase RibD [Maribellus sediminis]|uniref:bifunctional diaminohydroxyphosphoribosylaminopyrimidine deaminase/5-amino-6-(5-phosphoribosylamino)uracil reductase RibD n=1 Tax=Maribellus sediminis TaxID=2696285 RepID=UPI001431C004|nr:bifunctional diaminohydroxyphosphoribosylaminopyrimidine deaminase/5-amino-6-(5-phosphoribosylamino)uracil reductase RibD [Maribellus sediminis]